MGTSAQNARPQNILIQNPGSAGAFDFIQRLGFRLVFKTAALKHQGTHIAARKLVGNR
jgi:hypothetical protein